MDFGCAAYCQYAEQCIGNLPQELTAQKEELLKDRVAIEMKRYFKTDFKRIGHASRVARHAEQIGKLEQGNLAVILTAAYLHDSGFPEAERKYGAEASQHHEAEGPAVARSILISVGAKPELIEEVCDMIARHHRPGSNESINFKVVYDADLLENLDAENQRRRMDPEELEQCVRRSFMTLGGKKVARELLIK